MGAEHANKFTKERIIKEITEVIKESAGVYSYRVEKIAEVGEVAHAIITVELHTDSEGKKVVI